MPRSTSVAAAAAVALALGAVTVTHGAAPAHAEPGKRFSPKGAERRPSTSALTTLRKEQAQHVDELPTHTVDDQAIRFAANNAWTIRADSATQLADDSAGQINNLVQQVAASHEGRAHINWTDYNTAIYTVAPGTKRVHINFVDCQHQGIMGDLYTGRKIFENVPVPDDALPSAGNDGEMTIYDPQSDQVWDLWQMQRQGSGWGACWGGRIDNASQNRGYFQSTEGASASGMAIAGGAISFADMKRGYINHALNLNIRNTAGWQTWTWPAQRADGVGSAGWGSLRTGQRLRLDPSVDVTKLGLNSFGVMIAKAAQQYGFIVTDSSPDVGLVTQSAVKEVATTGVNPWPAYMGGDEWNVLPNFPWSKMQALPLAYGK